MSVESTSKLSSQIAETMRPEAQQRVFGANPFEPAYQAKILGTGEGQ